MKNNCALFQKIKIYRYDDDYCRKSNNSFHVKFVRVWWIFTRFLVFVHILFRIKYTFFCHVKYREIFAWMAIVEFLICMECNRYARTLSANCWKKKSVNFYIMYNAADILGYRVQQVEKKNQLVFIYDAIQRITSCGTVCEYTINECNAFINIIEKK